MGALKQLFTPLAYLRIQHTVKPWFDWYVPLLVSIVGISVLCLLPKSVDIFGNNGLIFVITDLIKILVGFYIAALAAVATFQNAPMDEVFVGDPATLHVSRRGVDKVATLTRRQFLCYLFGYLAFMGVVIYFLGAIVTLLASNLRMLGDGMFFELAKSIFIFFYLFITANSLTTTLLGLHFLTDRMHR